jgi:Transposase, Mutator family
MALMSAQGCKSFAVRQGAWGVARSGLPHRARPSRSGWPSWSRIWLILRSLNRRGLRGVKFVVSNSHEGIKAAASKF